MKKELWIVIAFSVVIVSRLSMAQEAKPGPEPSATDLAKQLSNPIANLVSVPLQLNWQEGVGPYNDLSFNMKF